MNGDPLNRDFRGDITCDAHDRISIPVCVDGSKTDFMFPPKDSGATSINAANSAFQTLRPIPALTPEIVLITIMYHKLFDQCLLARYCIDLYNLERGDRQIKKLVKEARWRERNYLPKQMGRAGSSQQTIAETGVSCSDSNQQHRMNFMPMPNNGNEELLNGEVINSLLSAWRAHTRNARTLFSNMKAVVKILRLGKEPEPLAESAKLTRRPSAELGARRFRQASQKVGTGGASAGVGSVALEATTVDKYESNEPINKSVKMDPEITITNRGRQQQVNKPGTAHLVSMNLDVFAKIKNIGFGKQLRPTTRKFTKKVKLIPINAKRKAQLLSELYSYVKMLPTVMKVFYNIFGISADKLSCIAASSAIAVHLPSYFGAARVGLKRGNLRSGHPFPFPEEAIYNRLRIVTMEEYNSFISDYRNSGLITNYLLRYVNRGIIPLSLVVDLLIVALDALDSPSIVIRSVGLLCCKWLCFDVNFYERFFKLNGFLVICSNSIDTEGNIKEIVRPSRTQPFPFSTVSTQRSPHKEYEGGGGLDRQASGGTKSAKSTEENTPHEMGIAGLNVITGTIAENSGRGNVSMTTGEILGLNKNNNDAILGRGLHDLSRLNAAHILPSAYTYSFLNEELYNALDLFHYVVRLHLNTMIFSDRSKYFRYCNNAVPFHSRNHHNNVETSLFAPITVAAPNAEHYTQQHQRNLQRGVSFRRKDMGTFAASVGGATRGKVEGSRPSGITIPRLCRVRNTRSVGGRGVEGMSVREQESFNVRKEPFAANINMLKRNTLFGDYGSGYYDMLGSVVITDVAARPTRLASDFKVRKESLLEKLAFPQRIIEALQSLPPTKGIDKVDGDSNILDFESCASAFLTCCIARMVAYVINNGNFFLLFHNVESRCLSSRLPPSTTVKPFNSQCSSLRQSSMTENNGKHFGSRDFPSHSVSSLIPWYVVSRLVSFINYGDYPRGPYRYSVYTPEDVTHHITVGAAASPLFNDYKFGNRFDMNVRIREAVLTRSVASNGSLNMPTAKANFLNHDGGLPYENGEKSAKARQNAVNNALSLCVASQKTPVFFTDHELRVKAIYILLDILLTTPDLVAAVNGVSCLLSVSLSPTVTSPSLATLIVSNILMCFEDPTRRSALRDCDLDSIFVPFTDHGEKAIQGMSEACRKTVESVFGKSSDTNAEMNSLLLERGNRTVGAGIQQDKGNNQELSVQLGNRHEPITEINGFFFVDRMQKLTLLSPIQYTTNLPKGTTRALPLRTLSSLSIEEILHIQDNILTMKPVYSDIMHRTRQVISMMMTTWSGLLWISTESRSLKALINYLGLSSRNEESKFFSVQTNDRRSAEGEELTGVQAAQDAKNADKAMSADSCNMVHGSAEMSTAEISERRSLSIIALFNFILWKMTPHRGRGVQESLASKAETATLAMAAEGAMEGGGISAVGLTATNATFLAQQQQQRSSILMGRKMGGSGPEQKAIANPKVCSPSITRRNNPHSSKRLLLLDGERDGGYPISEIYSVTNSPLTGGQDENKESGATEVMGPAGHATGVDGTAVIGSSICNSHFLDSALQRYREKTGYHEQQHYFAGSNVVGRDDMWMKKDFGGGSVFDMIATLVEHPITESVGYNMLDPFVGALLNVLTVHGLPWALIELIKKGASAQEMRNAPYRKATEETETAQKSGTTTSAASARGTKHKITDGSLVLEASKLLMHLITLISTLLPRSSANYVINELNRTISTMSLAETDFAPICTMQSPSSSFGPAGAAGRNLAASAVDVNEPKNALTLGKKPGVGHETTHVPVGAYIERLLGSQAVYGSSSRAYGLGNNDSETIFTAKNFFNYAKTLWENDAKMTTKLAQGAFNKVAVTSLPPAIRMTFKKETPEESGSKKEGGLKGGSAPQFCGVGNKKLIFQAEFAQHVSAADQVFFNLLLGSKIEKNVVAYTEEGAWTLYQGDADAEPDTTIEKPINSHSSGLTAGTGYGSTKGGDPFNVDPLSPLPLERLPLSNFASPQRPVKRKSESSVINYYTEWDLDAIITMLHQEVFSNAKRLTYLTQYTGILDGLLQFFMPPVCPPPSSLMNIFYRQDPHSERSSEVNLGGSFALARQRKSQSITSQAADAPSTRNTSPSIPLTVFIADQNQETVYDINNNKENNNKNDEKVSGNYHNSDYINNTDTKGNGDNNEPNQTPFPRTTREDEEKMEVPYGTNDNTSSCNLPFTGGEEFECSFALKNVLGNKIVDTFSNPSTIVNMSNNVNSAILATAKICNPPLNRKDILKRQKEANLFTTLIRTYYREGGDGNAAQTSTLTTINEKDATKSEGSAGATVSETGVFHQQNMASKKGMNTVLVPIIYAYLSPYTTNISTLSWIFSSLVDQLLCGGDAGTSALENSGFIIAMRNMFLEPVVGKFYPLDHKGKVDANGSNTINSFVNNNTNAFATTSMNATETLSTSTVRPTTPIILKKVDGGGCGRAAVEAGESEVLLQDLREFKALDYYFYNNCSVKSKGLSRDMYVLTKLIEKTTLLESSSQSPKDQTDLTVITNAPAERFSADGASIPVGKSMTAVCFPTISHQNAFNASPPIQPLTTNPLAISASASSVKDTKIILGSSQLESTMIQYYIQILSQFTARSDGLSLLKKYGILEIIRALFKMQITGNSGYNKPKSISKEISSPLAMNITSSNNSDTEKNLTTNPNPLSISVGEAGDSSVNNIFTSLQQSNFLFKRTYSVFGRIQRRRAANLNQRALLLINTQKSSENIAHDDQNSSVVAAIQKMLTYSPVGVISQKLLARLCIRLLQTLFFGSVPHYGICEELRQVLVMSVTGLAPVSDDNPANRTPRTTATIKGLPSAATVAAAVATADEDDQAISASGIFDFTTIIINDRIKLLALFQLSWIIWRDLSCRMTFAVDLLLTVIKDHSHKVSASASILATETLVASGYGKSAFLKNLIASGSTQTLKILDFLNPDVENFGNVAFPNATNLQGSSAKRRSLGATLGGVWRNTFQMSAAHKEFFCTIAIINSNMLIIERCFKLLCSICFLNPDAMKYLIHKEPVILLESEILNGQAARCRDHHIAHGTQNDSALSHDKGGVNSAGINGAFHHTLQPSFTGFYSSENLGQTAHSASMRTFPNGSMGSTSGLGGAGACQFLNSDEMQFYIYVPDIDINQFFYRMLAHPEGFRFLSTHTCTGIPITRHSQPFTSEGGGNLEIPNNSISGVVSGTYRTPAADGGTASRFDGVALGSPMKQEVSDNSFSGNLFGSFDTTTTRRREHNLHLRSWLECEIEYWERIGCLNYVDTINGILYAHCTSKLLGGNGQGTMGVPGTGGVCSGPRMWLGEVKPFMEGTLFSSDTLAKPATSLGRNRYFRIHSDPLLGFHVRQSPEAGGVTAAAIDGGRTVVPMKKISGEPLSGQLSGSPFNPDKIVDDIKKCMARATTQTTASEAAALRGGDSNSAVFSFSAPYLTAAGMKMCVFPDHILQYLCQHKEGVDYVIHKTQLFTTSVKILMLTQPTLMKLETTISTHNLVSGVPVLSASPAAKAVVHHHGNSVASLNSDNSMLGSVFRRRKINQQIPIVYSVKESLRCLSCCAGDENEVTHYCRYHNNTSNRKVSLDFSESDQDDDEAFPYTNSVAETNDLTSYRMPTNTSMIKPDLFSCNDYTHDSSYGKLGAYGNNSIKYIRNKGRTIPYLGGNMTTDYPLNSQAEGELHRSTLAGTVTPDGNYYLMPPNGRNCPQLHYSFQCGESESLMSTPSLRGPTNSNMISGPHGPFLPLQPILVFKMDVLENKAPLVSATAAVVSARYDTAKRSRQRNAPIIVDQTTRPRGEINTRDEFKEKTDGKISANNQLLKEDSGLYKEKVTFNDMKSNGLRRMRERPFKFVSLHTNKLFGGTSHLTRINSNDSLDVGGPVMNTMSLKEQSPKDVFPYVRTPAGCRNFSVHRERLGYGATTVGVDSASGEHYASTYSDYILKFNPYGFLNVPYDKDGEYSDEIGFKEMENCTYNLERNSVDGNSALETLNVIRAIEAALYVISFIGGSSDYGFENVQKGRGIVVYQTSNCTFPATVTAPPSAATEMGSLCNNSRSEGWGGSASCFGATYGGSDKSLSRIFESRIAAAAVSDGDDNECCNATKIAPCTSGTQTGAFSAFYNPRSAEAMPDGAHAKIPLFMREDSLVVDLDDNLLREIEQFNDHFMAGQMDEDRSRIYAGTGYGLNETPLNLGGEPPMVKKKGNMGSFLSTNEGAAESVSEDASCGRVMASTYAKNALLKRISLLGRYSELPTIRGAVVIAYSILGRSTKAQEYFNGVNCAVISKKQGYVSTGYTPFNFDLQHPMFANLLFSLPAWRRGSSRGTDGLGLVKKGMSSFNTLGQQNTSQNGDSVNRYGGPMRHLYGRNFFYNYNVRSMKRQATVPFCVCYVQHSTQSWMHLPRRPYLCPGPVYSYNFTPQILPASVDVSFPQPEPLCLKGVSKDVAEAILNVLHPLLKEESKILLYAMLKGMCEYIKLHADYKAERKRLEKAGVGSTMGSGITWSTHVPTGTAAVIARGQPSYDSEGNGSSGAGHGQGQGYYFTEPDSGGVSVMKDTPAKKNRNSNITIINKKNNHDIDEYNSIYCRVQELENAMQLRQPCIAISKTSSIMFMRSVLKRYKMMQLERKFLAEFYSRLRELRYRLESSEDLLDSDEESESEEY